MALKLCDECEKEVSTEARACPHCGFDFGWSTSTKVLVGGGLLTVVIYCDVVLGKSFSLIVLDILKKASE